MNQEVTESLIATFRSYLSQHGNGPEATGMSLEGQRFRFAKLSEIADLKDRRVLDLGCGLGDFYPFLVVIERRREPLGEFVAPKHGTDWLN